MADPGIPTLTPHGLLPPGIHVLTLEQAEALFGLFQKSERRSRLFARLATYLRELRAAGWAVAVILDGSFVMKCVDDPEDIDLLVILPTGWDRAAELPPHEYNLLSHRMAKRLYKLDVFAAEEGTDEQARWEEFFAGVNVKWEGAPLCLPPGLKKGLIRKPL
ncbi:MAG TPA: hypothetical protein VGI81_25270 [Tepidisphaeraceae bacterium]